MVFAVAVLRDAALPGCHRSGLMFLYPVAVEQTIRAAVGIVASLAGFCYLLVPAARDLFVLCAMPIDPAAITLVSLWKKPDDLHPAGATGLVLSGRQASPDRAYMGLQAGGNPVYRDFPGDVHPAARSPACLQRRCSYAISRRVPRRRAHGHRLAGLAVVGHGRSISMWPGLTPASVTDGQGRTRYWRPPLLGIALPASGPRRPDLVATSPQAMTGNPWSAI